MVKRAARICRNIYSSLSRSQKQWILIGVDFILISLSLLCALAIRLFALAVRFESLDLSSLSQEYFPITMVALLVKLVTLRVSGIYRPILRYVGLEIFYQVSYAIALSYGIIVFVGFFTQIRQLPRSVLLVDALLSILLIVGAHLLIRWCLYNPDSPFFIGEVPPKVIIYGAGAAGTQLAQALSHQQTYQVVAFIDNNRQLQGQQINGITVYSPKRLTRLVQHHEIKTILLAMPSVQAEVKQVILDALKHLPVTVKTIPELSEIISGKVPPSQLRPIEISDLLGRQEVPPLLELLSKNITDRAVLVTGAGGSIGSELCRQIAQHHPRVLILYERNEYALYTIDQELRETDPQLHPIPCLGCVTDENYLRHLLQTYQVDTIYHAAAYKHVPLVEQNPSQGVLNNVYGTLIAARTARDCHVKNFVLISTDKAVRPTNIMGATKRVGELILQAFAEDEPGATCFVMVRFGNVLDSNGSVVPRFRQQIEARKPITITHPEINRYFMSIPEAARLVIQAGALGQGGEVFLLDMGEPIKIYDLALQMIELHGLEVGKDIEVKITGLRPGEKLYEELLIDTNTAIQTDHPKIYAAKERMLPWQHLEAPLNLLLAAAQQRDDPQMMRVLYWLVPEFQRENQQMNQHLTIEP
ncbi:MAG: polysaccharide biosynthesis protein [Cyanobacteria bacterium]|jgi:FlaA1/EpsC-like NDP-sugar epimerase|nr:polysaccharide biosynthesis protein [Cyanobacteria bacterium GSL.Bin21]